MSDTFISYSRKDIAFAKIIHESLQSSQVETWIDWQDIPPSVDWFEEIKDAIEQADTFVFIISPTSVKSEICSKEIAHAELNNKRLIPIVIGDIDPHLVPSTLQALNWIFFKEEDREYAKALEDLITALTLDQPWLKAHTRIQNRALEWERGQQESGYLLHGADLAEAEAWLAQASGKDPAPTTLQTQYIVASRTQATRRQRRTLVGVAIGLVVAVALGIFAWTQRNVAVAEGHMRATAQVEAEHAKATAVEEAHSRATQQAIAEEQRIIAESKGLAALSLSKQNQNEFDLSLLLAVEGLNKKANYDTKNAMLHALTYNSKLARYLKVDEISDIYVVGANSDLTQIAVAGEEGKVYVLNPVTGVLEYPPIDLGGMEVNDIIFSPDNSILIVSGWFDGEVFLYNAATGQALDYSLHLSKYRANYLSFIDDTVLVGLGESNNQTDSIYFWDLMSGDVIDQIETDMNGYDRMTISNDKSLIAVADSKLQIFDVETRDMVVNQDLANASVVSMSFSPDDRVLALGDRRGKITLWDVTAQEKNSITLNHDDEETVDHVLFVGTSTLLSADQKFIYFWNYRTGDRLSKWSYDGIFYTKNNMEVSSDKQMLIVGESSGRISLYTIWDTPAGKIPFQYKDYRIGILKFPASGDYAYSIISKYGDEDYFEEEEIVVWDLSTGELTPERIKPELDALEHAEISFDETIMAYTGHNVGQDWGNEKLIEFFDLSNGIKMAQAFQFEDYSNIRDFCFYPTENYLVVISDSHDLIVYDYINAAVIAGPVNLGNYEDDYPEIIVDPSGEWIFVSEGDHVIRMYNARTLEPGDYSFAGHQDVISSMDISSDGAYLVSEGWDNQLILWDVHTGEIISKISNLSRFRFGIYGVRFSPDGSMIAVAYDEMLQFLSIPSLDPLGPALYGNIRHLNAAFDETNPLLSYGGYFDPGGPGQFSPDGTKLLVGGEDNMRLITLSISDWIERACFRAGRNLTVKEWATYLPFDEYRKTCPQYP